MLRLKELRKLKNITQKDISQSLNLTQQTYSDYENNKTNPDIKTIVDLANYFGCSIDYLVGREDDFGNIVVSGNGPTVPALTKEETWLLEMFRKVDTKTQYKVLGYLQAFI